MKEYKCTVEVHYFAEDLEDSLEMFEEDLQRKDLTLHSVEIESDYEYDEEGHMLSCCGDQLDPDIMLCPTCKEHC